LGSCRFFQRILNQSLLGEILEGFSVFKRRLAMTFIGIVGARKYKDRKSVDNLVDMLPSDSIIVTSRCKGVCTWSKERADQKNFEVLVYAPDLTNIRSWFDVPKRYYQRNRELVEKCDLLHVFISKEDGYIGGTRFEAEYALRLCKPVCFHWEQGSSEFIFQQCFTFMENRKAFLFKWQDFFKTVFD
jgi:hypothetical protein